MSTIQFSQGTKKKKRGEKKKMIVAKKSGTFVAGGAAGILMIINMDDLMYGQLRRHVIHPFRMLVSQPSVESKEIMELGSGAGKFASQFRPHAT